MAVVVVIVVVVVTEVRSEKRKLFAVARLGLAWLAAETPNFTRFSLSLSLSLSLFALSSDWHVSLRSLYPFLFLCSYQISHDGWFS